MLKILFFLLILSVVFLKVGYTQSITYILDELNRIDKIEYPDGTIITFSYDEVGNRTTKQIISSSQSYVTVNSKSYLQGPFHQDSLDQSLKINNFLPLKQPYNSSPWLYAGNESVSSIPTNAVDWVLIELRTGTASSTKVGTRAAFINKNGLIVDTDGTSPVRFNDLSSGNYFIAVYHRNHLSIMSASSQSLNTSSTLYDFSTSQSRAYGINPMVNLSTGIYGMPAGDTNGSGAIDQTDQDSTWTNVNKTGYSASDTDMSGTVDANDRLHTWNNRNKTSQVPVSQPVSSKSVKFKKIKKSEQK